MILIIVIWKVYKESKCKKFLSYNNVKVKLQIQQECLFKLYFAFLL